MNESISAPFIRYPIATSLLMVGILFVGIVAYPQLPVAPLPQVDFPTIQVSAQLPGASPETMASSVAQPLETQFAQIPGVAQMTSTSTLGSTAITMQFDLDRNIDGAANDVQAAINAASGQLPKNLPTPADLSQGQSGRFADPAAVGDVRHAAADRGRRQCRRPARPADQPDPRRRAGDDRRPAEARRPHPARSGQAGRQGPVAGGRAHASSSIATVDNAQRHHRRRQPRSYTIYANDQLARGQGLERRHRRLSQRRAAAGARHRPGGRRARGHQAGGLGRRQARRLPGHLQAARRQRHRHRRQHHGASCRG